MYSKELARKARQVNLAAYLLSVGEPLKKEGGRCHRHKKHKTLTFADNMFTWSDKKGQGKGIENGNSIDYLVNHMKMTPMEAITALTDASFQIMSKEKNNISEPANTFSLAHVVTDSDNMKTRRYLSEERAIGYPVINYLIDNKLLIQEKGAKGYGNALFLTYDEHGACVGGELQGITKKRFNGLKSGSKYGYGFNIRFSKDGAFDRALFFKSAVDLVSFIEYTKYHKGDKLDKCILISMAGLKPNTVKCCLKAFKRSPKPVMCIGNHESGREFLKKLDGLNIKYSLCLPDEKYEDWNEQLQKTKRECTPIGRLQNRAEEYVKQQSFKS
jgi:hypothetical protein